MDRRSVLGAAAASVAFAGCIGFGDDDPDDGTDDEETVATTDTGDDDAAGSGETDTEDGDTADGDTEDGDTTDGDTEDGNTTDGDTDGTDGSDQLVVAVGDATGRTGDQVAVPLSFTPDGENPPAEIDGHEVEFTYDDSLIEPVHEPGSTVSLESDSGQVTYTIGADPRDGTMVFSTLDTTAVPFGPGETFTFEVLTEDATTATIDVAVEFSGTDQELSAEYDAGELQLNQ